MGSRHLLWKLVLTLAGFHLALAPLVLEVAWRLAEWESRGAGAWSVFIVFNGAVGAAAGGLAWVVCSRSWRKLQPLVNAIKTLDRNETPIPLEVDPHSDWAPLAAAIQKLQRRITRLGERLGQENARLLTALEGMEEGVLLLDNEDRVLFVNAAGRRLLDVSAQNIVGRRLVEIVRNREIHTVIAESLGTGETCETELEIAGEFRRWLRVRAQRLPGEPFPGVILVVDDVSQLRRLENMRTEFAANVSHELKTPLATIKAYAETLRLGAVHDPEINLTFVSRIEEHADRLHYLIADLMRLARVESGNEVFEIAKLPLDELIEECVDYHREMAEARRISLSVTPPSSRLFVRGDEVGVRTILDNLVNNAIKYTPEGGRVEVAWERDGEDVRFEVRDTGIGIAPQDQERVFERFFRVDQARSRDVGGTGLGLAIVKHTAQALGGRVGLESEVGRGSTFRVWLPHATSPCTANSSRN